MSSPPTAHENSRVDTGDVSIDAVKRPIEAVGFWTAVVLPFLYLPLFFAGLPSTEMQLAFAVLVGAHVLALVVGHDYNASASSHG